MSRWVLVRAAGAGLAAVLVVLWVGPRVSVCRDNAAGGSCETSGGTDLVNALLVGVGVAVLVLVGRWVLDGRR